MRSFVIFHVLWCTSEKEYWIFSKNFHDRDSRICAIKELDQHVDTSTRMDSLEVYCTWEEGRGREGCHVLLFMGMQCLISIWSGTDHRFDHMDPKSITIVSTLCYQGPEQSMFCCSSSYSFFNTHNFWFCFYMFFFSKKEGKGFKRHSPLPPLNRPKVLLHVKT